MANQEKANAGPLVIKLPHPYLTSYEVTKCISKDQPARLQILPSKGSSGRQGLPLPTPLHDEALTFTEVAYLADDVVPKTGDNSSWARARRSPHVTVSWPAERPSVAKLWLISYALVSLHPLFEQVRVLFSGRDSNLLARELYATGLFHPHPKTSAASAPHDGHLLLRGAFWQGAGSPFGSRPIWAPRLDAVGKPITKEYPPFPFQIAPNTQFPAQSRHTLHPVREPKPEPGSIIYSRWIPHLKEHFTMVAIDYTNSEHLDLFHNWQNDPRVAAAWKETGSLEEHREYLRKMHEDPHVVTMFAAFDDILFAYFEVYWAMESSMGGFYQSAPYDRGRHSLVGDVRFRGPHRVSAWWSSLAHYCFLDEPRTSRLVGEPSITGTAVFAYDFAHGFHVEKLMDLPHKRSALQMVNREKFFTLSPFVWDGEKTVRPSLDALARL